jgi:hypothetical protein
MENDVVAANAAVPNSALVASAPALSTFFNKARFISCLLGMFVLTDYYGVFIGAALLWRMDI